MLSQGTTFVTKGSRAIPGYRRVPAGHCSAMAAVTRLAPFTKLYFKLTDSLQDSPQAPRTSHVPQVCAGIMRANREWESTVMISYGTIFYVDDNTKSRRVLTSVIKSCGFDVVSAGDPVEALSLLRKCSFDLALLDYQMPRLTGSQLAQKIKSAKPNVPVVLISGFSALPPVELIFVDAHVGRGATLDELLDTMRSLIQSKCSFAKEGFLPPPSTTPVVECGHLRR